MNEIINEYNNKFPIGYRCLNDTPYWNHDTGTQYWLILIIILIIYFICSVLFESFRLPLAIIMIIPISFIGTFLTFYWSGIKFGTGGFASLILLSGLVVNSGIYIVNEYGNLLSKQRNSYIHLYVKAYNHKIIPVFLTTLSTILGLIPFLFDGIKEEFWFSFAVGTSGGLLFSIIALICFFPVFIPLSNKCKSLPA